MAKGGMNIVGMILKWIINCFVKHNFQILYFNMNDSV